MQLLNSHFSLKNKKKTQILNHAIKTGPTVTANIDKSEEFRTPADYIIIFLNRSLSFSLPWVLFVLADQEHQVVPLFLPCRRVLEHQVYQSVIFMDKGKQN